MFKLQSNFTPTGDQPQAISKLSKGIEAGLKNQVLLGVTGSGKTFTMANIISKLQIPTLIISHNKTLAGQVYQEMRDFFPTNAISYFVSYYDYYQPEAYLPSSDTYIEKEAEINELIDKLRLQSTANILTRRDVVVVASVSCIYNIGSPAEYGNWILSLKVGDTLEQKKLFMDLAKLQYERSEFDFKRGTFRVRGPVVDIYPAYEDFGYKVTSQSGRIDKIEKFDPLTGVVDEKESDQIITIYPAKHFMTSPQAIKDAESQIRSDLESEYKELKKSGKLIEAERLLKKVNYDLEIIKEVGYVNGIENYSRYFDGRKPGDPPHSLIDYFKKAYGDEFLVFIDESHMSVPQIRGMYNGDWARKKNLIDFGFRLKSAFDNRPLRFEEFYASVPRIVYVSATPAPWEVNQSELEIVEKKYKEHGGTVEQLVRPTGIPDPQIRIHPATDEIPHLIGEIEKRVARGEKTLVTTLTKRTAEDLTLYLKEKDIRASYLHSDILTLERSDILDSLRKNEYDVLIGVNLLREGLDLPEVTLVVILDADREGFLRSRTALVQIMGRAARNIDGEVILYADTLTGSIKEAMAEVDRRREHQLKYNKEHGITAKTILKPIRERIAEKHDAVGFEAEYDTILNPEVTNFLTSIDSDGLTPYDKKRVIKKLEREMKEQASAMNFELAIQIRDKIREIKT